jgi:hypothetical protein
VMLPRFWRAKSEQARTQGARVLKSNTWATEDAAWRRFAAARSTEGIA